MTANVRKWQILLKNAANEERAESVLRPLPTTSPVQCHRKADAVTPHCFSDRRRGPSGPFFIAAPAALKNSRQEAGRAFSTESALSGLATASFLVHDSELRSVIAARQPANGTSPRRHPRRRCSRLQPADGSRRGGYAHDAQSTT